MDWMALLAKVLGPGGGEAGAADAGASAMPMPAGSPSMGGGAMPGGNADALANLGWHGTPYHWNPMFGPDPSKPMQLPAPTARGFGYR